MNDLRALGLGRMPDNGQAILVHFNRAPSDDELRALHGILRHCSVSAELVNADHFLDKCDAALEKHRLAEVYTEEWADTQLELHRTRDFAVKRRADALAKVYR